MSRKQFSLVFAAVAAVVVGVLVTLGYLDLDAFKDLWEFFGSSSE